MPYYWAARQPKPVEPGFRIPGWDPSRGGPDIVRLEEVWEDVRRTEFPDRPSRLGAVFVCPSLKCMFCDPKSWRNDPSISGGVYEVSVSGKKFVANSECFTAARQDASEGDWDGVRQWGKQYWSGMFSMESLKEVVVQGTVIVKRRLLPGDKRGSGSPPIRVATTRNPLTLSPSRVAERHISRTASRTKTAGEVRFIKDRGGDKNEWAWGTPGPSNREIGEDFTFNARYLKPLSLTLRATLMAMGHAISAQNTFAKIKSADISPDGNLGGKGYIQKVADMRRAYMNVVEALSALSDTLHDEIKAPHWNPEAPDGGSREREEVQSILQDAAEVEEDPEGWAEEEEAEMKEEREEAGGEPDADPLPDDPPEIVEANNKPKRGKRAALALSVALQHLRTAR